VHIFSVPVNYHHVVELAVPIAGDARQLVRFGGGIWSYIFTSMVENVDTGKIRLLWKWFFGDYRNNFEYIAFFCDLCERLSSIPANIIDINRSAIGSAVLVFPGDGFKYAGADLPFYIHHYPR